MTYITFQVTDTAQIDNILAYAQRENFQVEVSDYKTEKYSFLPPVTLTDEEMESIEQSRQSGICTDISELKNYIKSQL